MLTLYTYTSKINRMHFIIYKNINVTYKIFTVNLLNKFIQSLEVTINSL